MPLIIITLLNESRAHTKLQGDRYGGKNCKNLGRFILIGDMITISGGSRGGARGTRPPYFWTKLRPEGLDRAPHLSKGLVDRPPPPPTPLFQGLDPALSIMYFYCYLSFVIRLV